MKSLLKLSLPLLAGGLAWTAISCLEPADLYRCDLAAGDSGSTGCLANETCSPTLGVCVKIDGGAGTDAGSPDASTDAGDPGDAGTPDSGDQDAGTPDAGVQDAGNACGQVVCQGAAPICDPADGLCRACESNTECSEPSAPVCHSSGACEQCEDDGDCGANAPQTVCDPVNRVCVECVQSAPDCNFAAAGQVCDTQNKVCVACLPATQSTDCDPSTPLCNPANHQCEQCVTAEDCPNGGELCEAGFCVPSGVDGGVDGGLDAGGPDGGDLDAGTLDAGPTVGCLSSTDCATNAINKVCDTDLGECVPCFGNEGCAGIVGRPVCLDTVTPHRCVECESSPECTLRPGHDTCNTATNWCECSSNLGCQTADNRYILCSAGTCIQCTNSTDCPGNSASVRTICDLGTCVQCQSDGDCGTDICDDGLCI